MLPRDFIKTLEDIHSPQGFYKVSDFKKSLQHSNPKAICTILFFISFELYQIHLYYMMILKAFNIFLGML